MKLRAFSLLPLLLLSFTLIGQTGLVSGELNVSTIPTNNGNGTFTMVGNFSDPKGLYFAGDVTADMSIWKGNNYFAITASSANGSELTLTVEDTYTIGFLGTGVYTVGELTERLQLPGVGTTGDSNPALTTAPDYGAKVNYILTLIDQGVPEAISGSTLSDTSLVNNPADGDVLIAGDTLSFYDGAQWVNVILGDAGKDDHLGTDDQILDDNRSIDLDVYLLDLDATGVAPDNWAFRFTDPLGRNIGVYIDDGGDARFRTDVVETTDGKVIIDYDRTNELTFGNQEDTTIISGDKVFLDITNMVEDNELPKVLGRSSSGELKEIPVNAFNFLTDTIVSQNSDLQAELFIYRSLNDGDWRLSHNSSDTTLASHMITYQINDSTFAIQRWGPAWLESHNRCLNDFYFLDTLGRADNVQPEIGSYAQALIYATNPDKVNLEISNPVVISTAYNKQNLITYSEDYNAGTHWLRTNDVKITPDSIVGPFGDCITADYFYAEGSGGGVQRLGHATLAGAVYNPGNDYVFSAYFKASEIEIVSMTINSPCSVFVTYNLNTLTKLGGTGTIKDVGNGWRQVSLSCNAVNTDGDYYMTLGNGAFTPTGREGVFLDRVTVTEGTLAPDKYNYRKTNKYPIQ